METRIAQMLYKKRIWLLFLTVSLQLSAQPAGFSFLNFTQLRQGQQYEVYADLPLVGRSKIATGKVMVLGQNQLYFYTEIRFGNYRGNNHFKLSYMGRYAGDHKLKVTITDDMKMSHSNLQKEVICDSFLAENGILTFQSTHDQQPLYFQLSAKEKSISKIITNYGQVRLQRSY